jgi:hypothetical protein
MAKTRTTRAVAAGAVALSVLGPGKATAATAATRTVVLHVSDLAGVPVRDRAEAEKRATRVYEQIGVRLAWTNGDAAHAPADRSLHLDVVVLPGDMSDRMNADRTQFGQASHVTRRAYIHFSRITAYAVQSGSDPACVLAMVLAHEIGHMLLPEYSHSPIGLMRAEWTGRFVDVPDFDRQQGATIRLSLIQPKADTTAIAAGKERGTARSDR